MGNACKVAMGICSRGLVLVAASLSAVSMLPAGSASEYDRNDAVVPEDSVDTFLTDQYKAAQALKGLNKLSSVKETQAELKSKIKMVSAAEPTQPKQDVVAKKAKKAKRVSVSEMITNLQNRAPQVLTSSKDLKEERDTARDAKLVTGINSVLHLKKKAAPKKQAAPAKAAPAK